MAIEKSVKCIGTIQEIPVAHRKWIKSHYGSNSLARSFHTSHDFARPGPIVVEINIHFDGRWQNANHYTIDCTLRRRYTATLFEARTSSRLGGQT